MLGQPDLVYHGIFNEKAQYRVHVCFGEKYVYLFETRAAQAVCEKGQFPRRSARQAGVIGCTSRGYIVPPMQILGCQRIPIPPDLTFCDKHGSTSAKGRTAVNVVKQMLTRGQLPIHLLPDEVTEKDLQIKGLDITVRCTATIQCKCDYDGGVQGTGNLYLEFAERNPLKCY